MSKLGRGCQNVIKRMWDTNVWVKFLGLSRRCKNDKKACEINSCITRKRMSKKTTEQKLPCKKGCMTRKRNSKSQRSTGRIQSYNQRFAWLGNMTISYMFRYFVLETYKVDSRWNHLHEAILKRTHTVCFIFIFTAEYHNYIKRSLRWLHWPH